MHALSVVSPKYPELQVQTHEFVVISKNVGVAQDNRIRFFKFSFSYKLIINYSNKINILK